MKRILSLLAIVMVALSLSGCGGTIDQGNVGVRTTFGKVTPEAVEPGIYVAIMSHVKEFTTKESAVALDNMTPKAKDNLSLKDLDVTVYYRTNGGKIPSLYVKYAGQNAMAKNSDIYFPAYHLVENLSRTAIFEEVAQQESLTIHQHRDEVANAVRKNVQDELDKNDPGTFTITRVVIRQVITDPAIEQSILLNVQMQKRVEAKNAELALAESEARRLVAEAEGLAKRNIILTQSITPTLIEYKKALAMENCAESQKCTMIIGNAAPMVNVGK